MHREHGDRDRRFTEYADVADGHGEAQPWRGRGKRHHARHKPYDKFSWTNRNDWRAYLEDDDPDAR